jgi:dTDP-4-dehydrorhamnose reductase
MKFLIAGSQGQLARAFQSRFERDGVDFAAPTERDLDVADERVVGEAIRSLRPSVVLNCAAYNDVDGAERDPGAASRVNETAVRHLARASREAGAFLVHYGTDYVFDGTKEGFYTEDDVPNPLSAYGRTKWMGERALSDEAPEHLLLRVSWVYGRGSQNFLSKLDQWSRGRTVVRAVTDQLSAPTCVTDIVEFTLRALRVGLRGLYHLTNGGYASRYEVARFYLRLVGRPVLVLPSLTADFPGPARRPFFSVMDNGRLSRALGVEIPAWENAMERFVRGGIGGAAA